MVQGQNKPGRQRLPILLEVGSSSGSLPATGKCYRRRFPLELPGAEEKGWLRSSLVRGSGESRARFGDVELTNEAAVTISKGLVDEGKRVSSGTGVGGAHPHGVKSLLLSFGVGDFGDDEARLALAGAEDEEDLRCAIAHVEWMERGDG